ncbi:zinc-ribbon domain-containing protein [Candidatus Nitrospira bockiana]
MSACRSCGQPLPESSRFCTRCGLPVHPESTLRPSTAREELNLPILYGMAALLVLGLIVPPWETPPHQPPEFLGFHFILNPPVTSSGDVGVVSRLLLTVELFTIAVTGLYLSWLFRSGKE